MDAEGHAATGGSQVDYGVGLDFPHVLYGRGAVSQVAVFAGAEDKVALGVLARDSTKG
jgi:hypothetical protein